jgi:hypothetical protein
MIKILNQETFKNVKKFVVTKGENYNADRCIQVDISEYCVTMCFNEEINRVAICDVNGEENDIVGKRILTEIIELATDSTYESNDEKEFTWYLEKIEPKTRCCNYNCSECDNYNKK